MGQTIMFTILEDVIFLILLFAIAMCLTPLFYRAYKGVAVWSKNGPKYGKIELKLYKLMGIDPNQSMTAKQYITHMLLFSLVSFVGLYAILFFQNFLIFNTEGYGGMSWHLAFNTTASFVSNTNWQSYSGETTLSYFSQMMGLTVQNFVSGAVGISALYALIRGFLNKEDKHLGNFYVDITKLSIYVMVPICFVGALVFVSQGVPQTMSGSLDYITLNGVNNTLYLGPAASQIMIKQLFTNGGGFYGTNSAFPLENPTPFSNLLECLSILVIPLSLCFVFGRAVSDKKQGTALVKVMTVFFITAVALATWAELSYQLKVDGVYNIGNMEGKEVRFGVGQSALWAAVTTSASNGSVNAMHDSFTPIGGLVPIFLMMLGEVIYGGVGCGLYGMIGFAILTVFIGGLMVGRTPEYLGKKIGSFDMKMVCLIILPPVLCMLIGTAATVMLPYVNEWVNTSNLGSAHAFSEILYAFVSQSANNGSAFAGYNANTPWTNMVGGSIMLFVRFVPMVATIYLASNLGGKKITPTSEGTLSTTNTMFVGMLIAVILLVGALSFLPALALGPLAEQLSSVSTVVKGVL